MAENFDAPKFVRLNEGWNADPNDPGLQVSVDSDVLTAQIRPNVFVYPSFQSIETIEIRFAGCSRYRVTPIDDEGWYRGQCRFSGLAPDWGEFYEIFGDTVDAMQPAPWIDADGQGTRHFHFFLRDETLEVKAQDWSMRSIDG